MQYCQGENSWMWPQAIILWPTRGPVSNITKGILRSTRWAAAARPTGPAPMIAIGNSYAEVPFVACLLTCVSNRPLVMNVLLFLDLCGMSNCVYAEIDAKHE